MLTGQPTPQQPQVLPQLLPPAKPSTSISQDSRGIEKADGALGQIDTLHNGAATVSHPSHQAAGQENRKSVDELSVCGFVSPSTGSVPFEAVTETLKKDGAQGETSVTELPNGSFSGTPEPCLSPQVSDPEKSPDPGYDASLDSRIEMLLSGKQISGLPLLNEGDGDTDSGVQSPPPSSHTPSHSCLEEVSPTPLPGFDDEENEEEEEVGDEEEEKEDNTSAPKFSPAERNLRPSATADKITAVKSSSTESVNTSSDGQRTIGPMAASTQVPKSIVGNLPVFRMPPPPLPMLIPPPGFTSLPPPPLPPYTLLPHTHLQGHIRCPCMLD